MRCLADDKTPDDKLFCHYGTPTPTVSKALVWGDSHATALIPVFDDGAQKHGVSVILASSPGCIPVEGLEHDAQCARFNRRVEQAMNAAIGGRCGAGRALEPVSVWRCERRSRACPEGFPWPL